MAKERLLPLLQPVIRLRLAETIMVQGRARFQEGEVVKARLSYIDAFGVEIAINSLDDHRIAIVGWSDLRDAEVVTDG